jgi:hypothetical protein
MEVVDMAALNGTTSGTAIGEEEIEDVAAKEVVESTESPTMTHPPTTFLLFTWMPTTFLPTIEEENVDNIEGRGYIVHNGEEENEQDEKEEKEEESTTTTVSNNNDIEFELRDEGKNYNNNNNNNRRTWTIANAQVEMNAYEKNGEIRNYLRSLL